MGLINLDHDRNSYLARDLINQSFKCVGIPMSASQMAMLIQPLGFDNVGDYNYMEMLGYLLGEQTMLKLI